MVLTYINTTKSELSNISDSRVNSQDTAGINYFELFLKSRQSMGVSPRTLQFYIERLSRIFASIDCTCITRQQIQDILNSIPANKYGFATRHATFRALKTFFIWLQREHCFPNPMEGLPAPILSKPILPTLTLTQVMELLKKCPNLRAKAIIALFVESGLRLSEASNLKLKDIDWESRTVRVMGKGRKEAEAPFGPLTDQYLKAWLQKKTGQLDTDMNIWGITTYGIVSMLRRLERATGLTCNPHVFRRTFAVLLRKAGIDTMTIQELGRWSSLIMVQRYTRSFTFRDSLRFYQPPLGQITDGGQCYE